MQAKRKVKHVRVRKNSDKPKDEEEPAKVPPSIAVLFSAHQFLGKSLIFAFATS